jgi:Flp pilus assembly protein TadB
MPRPPVRETVRSLVVMLTLIGVAEIVVHAAGWPRLTALLVFVVGGHMLEAVVSGLLTRRRRERAREHARRAQTTAPAPTVAEPYRW